MTLSEGITEYLEYLRASTTRAEENYGRYLKQFLETGDSLLKSITLSDVAKFQLTIRATKSPKTWEYVSSILRAFFHYHYSRISFDWRMVRVKKVLAKSHSIMEPQEFEALDKSVVDYEYPDLQKKLALNLLWNTGMRVRELVNLNLEDLQGNRAAIPTAKRHQKRIVMWSERTSYLLNQYLLIRKELGGEALFINIEYKDGWKGPITTRAVQRWFKVMCQRAGTRRLTPHCCRHGWAVFRRKKGAPFSFVQKGLGHSSPASTMFYQQYTDKDFEEEAASYL